MSTFPFAMIVSQTAMSEQFGFEHASALPHAPEVVDPPTRTPRSYRARTALAATLRRAAEAVAPGPQSHPAS
ncbi:hypothetical protein [Dactylosporangium sp. CA-092794]|uniref:hypothetical protein n=1 Tax=Dactylosporangium sp. CA-092794 TaxID=3239929 RepID=UPI003D8AF60B